MLKTISCLQDPIFFLQFLGRGFAYSDVGEHDLVDAFDLVDEVLAAEAGFEELDEGNSFRLLGIWTEEDSSIGTGNLGFFLGGLDAPRPGS